MENTTGLDWFTLQTITWMIQITLKVTKNILKDYANHIKLALMAYLARLSLMKTDN